MGHPVSEAEGENQKELGDRKRKNVKLIKNRSTQRRENAKQAKALHKI